MVELIAVVFIYRLERRLSVHLPSLHPLKLEEYGRLTKHLLFLFLLYIVYLLERDLVAWKYVRVNVGFQ